MLVKGHNKVALYVTVYRVVLSKSVFPVPEVLGYGNVAIYSLSVAMKILDLNL